MIKIATPISHLFKDPAAGQRIAAASDCLECREWCIDIELPGQELIHYDININMPWDQHERDGLLKAFRAKPDLGLVTFQMASDYTKPVIVDSMYRPGGELLSRAAMLENVRTNAAWLKSVLPAKVRIGIENNNYYPTHAYDVVTSPDFIRQCVVENDLRFLLDVAHAKVSAHNMKKDYADYITGLPLERLIQIHICCPKPRADGVMMDAHELPDEDITSAVVEAASRYPVEYLTVEYYKDADRLVSCLKDMTSVRDRIAKTRGH